MLPLLVMTGPMEVVVVVAVDVVTFIGALAKFTTLNQKEKEKNGKLKKICHEKLGAIKIIFAV